MGGSLGRSLVRRRLCREVRALARRQEAADAAIAFQAADIAGTEPEGILSNVDLLVLATPVRTIEAQIGSLSRYLKSGAVITDMGSVKSGIVRAMDDLPSRVHGVGGHPMCGKETAGIEASDPDLFLGKVWVLTPQANTDGKALNLVQELASAVGAKPLIMSAEDHDKVVACVSHLCYMLAATLVAVAEEAATELPAVWTLASSGFRDTSRVAAGDLTMMTDILSANKANVCQMLAKTRSRIDLFMDLLERGDERLLKAALADVRARRAAMFVNDRTLTTESSPDE